jgi:hypothetical protein
MRMINYERIKIFFERGKKVHVSCDGRFYNGKIIELNKEKGFLLLIDYKLGEVPIMFEEILTLEPYTEKEE